MSESSGDASKMERLLDPIRPSDGSVLRNDMSYLYGRDPSILSYGQRPGPSADCKKNLSSDYEIEESICQSTLGGESLSSPTVKVFLRLKPFPRKAKLTPEQEAAYEIVNSTTLLTRIPCFDNTTVSSKKNCHVETVCRKFTFTETFGPETSQLSLFERVIQPQMVEFFGGQNCIAMTYGTTNSGKSHTLQGSTSCPGIIPRSLEYVFSNINPKSSPCYKPIHNRDVISLSTNERAIEIETKTKILSSIIAEKHQYINAYKQMQKLLEEESPSRPSQASDAQYLVWVSFAEIYNEVIYDLLSNELQRRRSPLKLATDSQGRAFIRGLKTVCVSSGSEAYQVLMAGQCNLKVAATLLNPASSRSHCIFTITLLKFTSENRPDKVEISRFSFCDLAGSERLKKTLNVGDRLKEAQNINTSLLVLSRCLKSIYEGQMIKRHDHIGPFRESKLTRLFQQGLSGHEPMALIVNINPLPNLYEETQNVLTLAAIAKKIIIQPRKTKKRKSKTRFSLVVAQSAKTTTDWDDTELESIAENSSSEADDTQSNSSLLQEDYEEIISENESLKREVATLKASNLKRDLQIRNEMANTYTEMMAKLETDYKNKMLDLEKEQEELLEWQLDRLRVYYENKLSSRKRKTSDDDDDDDEDDDDEEESKVQELEAQVSHLSSENKSLKSMIKDVKKSKETIESEKNTLKYESSLLKDELKSVKALLTSMEENISSTGDSNAFVEELKSQLTAARDKIKKLKDMLNEAKDEYIAITDDCRAKEEAIAKLEEDYGLMKDRCKDLEAELEDVDVLIREGDKTRETLENDLEREIKIRRMLEKQLEMLKGTTSQLNNTKAFIKQEMLSPTDSDSREEVFLEFRDIPVPGDAEKNEVIELLKMEKENLVEEKRLLNDKLLDSVGEVEKLKNDLKSAKERLDEITVQLDRMRVKSSGLGDEESRNSGVEIVFDGQETCPGDQTSYCELNVECKSLQTTLNGGEELIETQKALDDLRIKFKELTVEYEVKVLVVQELTDELGVVRGKLEGLESSRVDGEHQNEIVVKENYELGNKLKEITVENDYLNEQVVNLRRSQEDLNTEIDGYKRNLVLLEMKIDDFKKSEESKVEELNKLSEELAFCKSEHLSEVSELKEKLRILVISNSDNDKVLEERFEKIKKLEEKIGLMRDLERELSEANSVLIKCQSEKKELEIELKNNEEKICDLTSRLEQSKLSEKDKDDEIVKLQKEVKGHITKVSDDSKVDETEREYKRIIQQLSETKLDLERSKKVNEELEAKVSLLETISKNSEQTQLVISTLQKNSEEQKAEIRDLKRTNASIIKSLDEKEVEMENFKKNRSETDAKYEILVKNIQEELEREKKEVRRFQELFIRQASTPREKDCNSGTFRAPSDDRGALKQKENKPKDPDTSIEASPKSNSSRRPRRGKKAALVPGTPNHENVIPVVELSDSETKRMTRRTAAANAAPSSEKRTRARKLLNLDESLVDLSSEIPPSPASTTRSLRTRRR